MQILAAMILPVITHSLTVIALFKVNFTHLHYNVIQRGCEAISG